MTDKRQKTGRAPSAFVYAPKPRTDLTSIFEAFPGGANRRAVARKVEGLLKQELRCLREDVTLGGREVKPVEQVIASSGSLN